MCHVDPWPWTPGYGRVYFYRGGAGGTLTEAGFLKDAQGAVIDIGDCSTPVLTDWNSDGLLDLVLGTYGPHDASNALFYEWRLYLNTGTKTAYKFASHSTITDSKGAAILASSLVIRDIDRDGRKDIIYTYKTTTRLAWYRNVGTSSVPKFDASENITLPAAAAPYTSFFDAADITGDGVLDLIYVNMYYAYYCKGVAFTNTAATKQTGVSRLWSMRTQGRQCFMRFGSGGFDGTMVRWYDCRGKTVAVRCVKNGSLSVVLPAAGLYTVIIDNDGAVYAEKICIE